MTKDEIRFIAKMFLSVLTAHVMTLAALGVLVEDKKLSDEIHDQAKKLTKEIDEIMSVMK